MKTAGVTRCMFIGCSQMSNEGVGVCACIHVSGLLNLGLGLVTHSQALGASIRGLEGIFISSIHNDILH